MARSTPAFTYTPARHRRRWPMAFGCLLLVLAGLGGGFAIGRSTAPASRLGAGTAGAGPRTVSDGLPTGYADTAAGAAVAAANYVVAVNAAAAGRSTPTAIIATLLATPTPAGEGSKLTGKETTSRTAALIAPVSGKVSAFSPTTATVQVWTSGANVYDSGNGQVIATGGWGTTTVQLVWQGDDWKVDATASTSGPDPGHDGKASDYDKVVFGSDVVPFQYVGG